MNKSNLKAYAPQARLDFIAAVTARANLLGITAKGASPVGIRGDLGIIDGREWPSKIVGPREKLIARIKLHGFDQSMEEVAYTWFNRFAALRFMEIHDYLDHGWRVISSRDGGLPEILGHAIDVSLPGLSQSRAQEMHMAGNQDNELYRLVLVAQCNALSRVMPFLFERIDDLTELLLPDNLLRTDSIIAKLVAGIPEEDWKEIEVIGWLYQFYISDKKDQVIGKVVKSEDIPAATQLFTPNWIVQYLVQNSVGRLWLMANPQSTLAQEWPYYITPAEQTPEVQAQLDALIQTRVREDGDTLNPESITVLDPACGSGHILVVAYDVLKAIYLERGYQPRAIPRLILEKNLYGLDIDDRAAQMAGFALLMKARADDRRLFTATDHTGNLQPPKLNVLSLQESKGLNVDELATHLAPFKVQRATITALVETFEHAKTFGSLIQIPYAVKTHLAALPAVLNLAKQSGDMYATAAADDLLPLVQQAQVLAMQFDAVVANPPYMGSSFFNDTLKDYVNLQFPRSKNDFCTAFLDRFLNQLNASGSLAFITIPAWLFISGFSDLREEIVANHSVISLLDNGRGLWGADFGSCGFVIGKSRISAYKAKFRKLFDSPSEVNAEETIRVRALSNKSFICSSDEFSLVDGSPFSYWASDATRHLYKNNKPLRSHTIPRAGISTGNNEKSICFWHEVDFSMIGFGLEENVRAFKYFPHNKAGGFRKWSGFQEFVIRYDATDISRMSGYAGFRHDNRNFYFSPSVSWGKVTIGAFSARYYPKGFLFDSAGICLFPNNPKYFLGLLNSRAFSYLLSAISRSMNYTVGDISRIPVDDKTSSSVRLDEVVSEAIAVSKADSDDFEQSWSFSVFPLIGARERCRLLADAWSVWEKQKVENIGILRALEEENNRIFINAYGLQDELTPEVPESQITLARADREKDCQRLISYAIGCMMGRYSLDEPGLIYAHAGNVGFDPSRYATFPADADGIVPVTDELWFADDACSRIREFLRAVWGADTLEENMAWLAESLGTKATETPDETIRRYIAVKFFKDHLQTYKKRPIYWLFSSGKQGAFQALVYLHRYSEGTLARMRTEYVVPLTSKIAYRLDMLEKDANASSSTAARSKIQKQAEALRKKQMELLAFDEKLRHYADMRIAIELDDGLKANYSKFGDLVAESKAITGGADE